MQDVILSPPHQSESNDLNRLSESSLTLSPMQTGASLIPEVKAKSAGSQSSFGCYLSSLSDSDDLPYKFWSVYLHYPEEIVSDTGEAKAAYKYRLKDSAKG